MSGIAGLYNVPSTYEEFNTWAGIHARHHLDIVSSIYRLFGVALEDFVLDPFDPEDPGDWLQNHQHMHSDMDALLGVSGYNLLNVDFKDKGQFGNWVFLNADEHFKVGNILGIG